MKRFILTAAVAALLAACTPKTDAPVAEAPAAPQIALYALDCGRITVSDADIFADDGAFKGVKREFVDPCYLIRHPSGDLLWDAGLPDALNALPAGVTDGPFSITVPKTLASQLAEIQVTPADVEFLSVSHSHFDHVGNAGAFAATSTFLVDPRERAFMFRDEAKKDAQQFASYSALETAKTVEIATDAPHDVFGDGSVEIHPAPGHTPGHRVLLVKLAEAGPVLLTGDMYHLAESREKRTVPRFNVDRAQTLAAMDAVEKLAADTGARVVRQHVPEDFAALPTFPEALR